MVEGTLTWEKRSKNIKLTNKVSQFDFNTYFRKIKALSLICLLALIFLIYKYYENELLVYPIILFYILYTSLNIYSAYYIFFRKKYFTNE
jgi:hypothetical protein